MKLYFGNIDEENIKQNFVVIYELLDECIDNGVITTTDPLFLQENIKTSYPDLNKAVTKKDASLKGPEVGKNITWRKEGIKYRSNEIYIDIIERLTLIVSTSGVVTKSEVVGEVEGNSKLSGMPNVEIVLNQRPISMNNLSNAEKLGFEDVKFHQCVDLADYDKN